MAFNTSDEYYLKLLLCFSLSLVLFLKSPSTYIPLKSLNWCFLGIPFTFHSPWTNILIYRLYHHLHNMDFESSISIQSIAYCLLKIFMWIFISQPPSSKSNLISAPCILLPYLPLNLQFSYRVFSKA